MTAEKHVAIAEQTTDPLEKLLKDEFLPRFDSLTSPLQYRWSKETKIEDYQTFLSKELEKWKELNTINNKIVEMKQKTLLDNNNPYHLASRIIEHDLTNIENAFFPGIQGMVNDQDDLRDNKYRELVWNEGGNAYLLLSTIAYLADGEKPERIISVTPEQVKKYLGQYMSDGDSLTVRLKSPIINLQHFSAIQNITNAKRYGKPPITVEISDGIDGVYSKVSDRGARIDLPWQDAHTLTDDYTTSGTGLGLSLSKRLLHAVGGWLEFYSNDQNGVAFEYSSHWEKAKSTGLTVPDRTHFITIIPTDTAR